MKRSLAGKDDNRNSATLSMSRSQNSASARNDHSSSGVSASVLTSRASHATQRSAHYLEPKLESSRKGSGGGPSDAEEEFLAFAGVPAYNSNLRFIPGKLYGRQVEIERLRAAVLAPRMRSEEVTESTDRSEEETGDILQVLQEKSDDLIIPERLEETADIQQQQGPQDSKESRKDKEETAPHPCKAVLLISGESGCGKTALATQLYQHRDDHARINGNNDTPSSCCYISGKYDFQQQPTQPYSAIAVALRYLCQHLMLREDAEDALKILLEESGETTIRVVATLIPSILTVFGLTEEGDNVDTTSGAKTKKVGMGEAQIRLSFAIAKFLRMVSTITLKEEKLICMLDDIQWADVESLQLFEVLARDEESPGLVLVGCYRSNEVKETHLLAKLIRDLKHTEEQKLGLGLQVTEIHLSNLTIDALNDMFSGLLHKEPSQTADLTQLVQQKTLGNAFFVVEFLKSLEERQLLEFCRGEWKWDDKEIEANTAATENAIDLMTMKMRELDPAIQQILPIAASLGSTFSGRALEVAVGSLSNENDRKDDLTGTPMPALEWIKRMIAVGFLEICDDSLSNCWVHDKIQESALLLVGSEDLRSLRYDIGKEMLANLTPGEFDQNLFVVMNLINECDNISELENDWRTTIADLNLNAAKHSMQAASFQQAAVYLRKGIEWLPDRGWEMQYDLTLDLYSTMAEAEFCNGNTESMELHCDAVMKQEGAPLEDTFRCCRILVDSMGNSNRLDEAIDLIVSTLKKLGCNFPKRGRMFHTVYELLSIKAAVKKVSREDITGLKRMNNGSRIMAMILLDKLATLAYYADSDLLALSIFKSFRWSLRYGISEYSPPAFVTVGLILATELGDLQQGRLYAEHALSLLEQMDCTEVVSRTVFLAHSMVLHYTMPAKQCRQPYLRAYEAGLGFGDVESAMWAIFTYVQTSFYTGLSLKSVAHDFRVYMKQMQEFSQETVLFCARTDGQVILNLLGQSDDRLRLIGEFSNAEVTLKSKDTDRYAKFFPAVAGNQMQLCYWFGEDVRGADLALEFEKRWKVMIKGAFASVFAHVHKALLGYGAARKPSSKRKQYLKVAKEQHKQVKTWVKNGNPNLIHLDKLLDAECAAQQGKNSAALGLYHVAVNMAEQAGLINDQALINERFGDYWLETGGRKSDIEDLWGKALRLYREWGAVAKVEQVKEKLVGIAKGPMHLVEVKEGGTDTCSLSMGDGLPAGRFWR